MTGIRFGAGELECADKMNKKLVRLTSVFNLAVSLAILLLHRPLVSVFTDTEAIISLSVGVFLVDTLTEHGRAISHVYEQSLRACTDVWFVMIATVISCWALSIGLAYVFSITFNMGLLGCYVGLMADELMRGVITRIRWHFIIKNKASRTVNACEM
jgi:Na+-driven multidrug efflux pump